MDWGCYSCLLYNEFIFLSVQNIQRPKKRNPQCGKYKDDMYSSTIFLIDLQPPRPPPRVPYASPISLFCTVCLFHLTSLHACTDGLSHPIVQYVCLSHFFVKLACPTSLSSLHLTPHCPVCVSHLIVQYAFPTSLSSTPVPLILLSIYLSLIIVVLSFCPNSLSYLSALTYCPVSLPLLIVLSLCPNSLSCLPALTHCPICLFRLIALSLCPN